MSLLDQLNPPQREAAETTEGPVVILAGAGSGKTLALTSRCAHILETCDVRPSQVCLMTFTNKVADEMRDRIASMVPPEKVRGLWAGTFHSLCGRILRQHPELINRSRDFAIYDDDDQKVLVKQAIQETIPSKQQQDWNAELVRDMISARKQEGVRPEDIPIESPRDETFRELWRTYERMLVAYNAMDFEDMILFACDLLRRQDDVGEKWRTRFRYVMVDEFQDTNKTQWELVRLLSQSRNLCVVGDDDQCARPGTRIMVDRHRSVRIETLRNGDLILPWNRNAQRMVCRSPVRVGSRRYSGCMLTVRTDRGRSVSVTPEHRFLCRFIDRQSLDCVTYLMWRKGFGFRVGWCQAFRVDNVFHLVVRARQEHADKAWVLRTFFSRTEASAYESIVAAKYGITTVIFEDHGENMASLDDAPKRRGKRISWKVARGHYSARVLRHIFDAIGTETLAHGMKALSDHGLDFDLPLYPWADRSIRRQRRTYVHVQACNLLPGMMAVPAPDGQNEWQTITKVTRAPYSGRVYSLAVKPHETYSANGIVTHNSIYGWRGADVKIIRGFTEVYPDAKLVKLEQNYRSTKRIVAAAHTVIVKGADRIDKALWTANPEGVKVTVIEGADEYDEARFVVEQMRRLLKAEHSPEAMAVLYRAHSISRVIEDELINNRIAYRIVGGFGFYDRKEVKGILSYLRLVVNPDSDVDTVRVINMQHRGIGAGTVKRLRELGRSRKMSMWGAIPTVGQLAEVRPRERDAIIGFRKRLEHLQALSMDVHRPSEFTARLIQETGFKRMWLEEEADKLAAGKKQQADEAHDRADNCDSLVEAIASYERKCFDTGETASLRGYLEMVSLVTKEKEATEKEAQKVTLMTVHAAKGLEYDYVWLVAMEEDRFPSGRVENDTQAEEERRLAYVAITRARRQLWLTMASQRMVYGQLKECKASRFTEDLVGAEGAVEYMSTEEYRELQCQALREI